MDKRTRPEETGNTVQVRKEQEQGYEGHRRFCFPEKPLAVSCTFRPLHCFSAYLQVQGKAATVLYRAVVFFPSVRDSFSFDAPAVRRSFPSVFSGGALGDPEGPKRMRAGKKGGAEK